MQISVPEFPYVKCLKHEIAYHLNGTLTYWGQMTHKCINKLTTIDSDNGSSPDRHQAVISTNADILLIGPFGTNFREILFGIQTFSFKKIHLKMSSVKCQPFCFGLNVLSNRNGNSMQPTWWWLNLDVFHCKWDISTIKFIHIFILFFRSHDVVFNIFYCMWDMIKYWILNWILLLQEIKWGDTT